MILPPKIRNHKNPGKNPQEGVHVVTLLQAGKNRANSSNCLRALNWAFKQVANRQGRVDRERERAGGSFVFLAGGKTTWLRLTSSINRRQLPEELMRSESTPGKFHPRTRCDPGMKQNNSLRPLIMRDKIQHPVVACLRKHLYVYIPLMSTHHQAHGFWTWCHAQKQQLMLSNTFLKKRRRLRGFLPDVNKTFSVWP